MSHQASMLRHICINASLYLVLAAVPMFESTTKPTATPEGDVALHPKPTLEWVNPNGDSNDSKFPLHKITPQERGSGR